MADMTPGVQQESASANLGGMANFLIDPHGAAPRLFTKWFWIYPLVVLIVVSLIANILVTPIVQHVLATQPMPPGVNPETYQARIDMGMKIQRYIGLLFPLLLVAFQALVLWGMCSVVAINATYRQMLNLASGCTLIQVLAAIASVIILKSKGDVSTVAELRPALGLDIFMPEGSNKILLALAGYFSIFEIWWIVMIILILAAAYRVSKGKAVTVIAPLVLISLIFRLVLAAFQK